MTLSWSDASIQNPAGIVLSNSKGAHKKYEPREQSPYDFLSKLFEVLCFHYFLFWRHSSIGISTIHILILILFQSLDPSLSKCCQKRFNCQGPSFPHSRTVLKEMAAVVQNQGTVEVPKWWNNIWLASFYRLLALRLCHGRRLYQCWDRCPH